MTLWNTLTRTLCAGSAAPTGRTRAIGGWGCAFLTCATPLLAFDVPSGQALTFQESFLEEQESGQVWARFRFVMPAIAQGLTYGDLTDDFVHLCQVYVVPGLEPAAMPDQIVISIGDRATEFGLPHPEATQFFEAFSVQNGDCIWGEF